MQKELTLCIVHEKDSVLLGMKKRGFGASRWNGFGGKVNSGETIEQATKREMFEESGLIPIEMKKLGELVFSFVGEETELRTHIYKCTSYTGTLGESEEMRPQWFKVAEIPFSEMWKDDVFWFPYFLSDQCFMGKFHFDAEHTILDQTLKPIEKF